MLVTFVAHSNPSCATPHAYRHLFDREESLGSRDAAAESTGLHGSWAVPIQIPGTAGETESSGVDLDVCYVLWTELSCEMQHAAWVHGFAHVHI